MPSGWTLYLQALEFLSQHEGETALLLLAKAETIFLGEDDLQGLWRALAGQAAAHWYIGDVPLAVARATVALRTATAAGDRLAEGVAAWQLALLHLRQEEYSAAADSLLHVQQTLGPERAEIIGESITAGALICREIEHWQDMHARRLVKRGTAEQVVSAIHRDLAGHLVQAAAVLHRLWGRDNPVDDIEPLLMTPRTPGELAPSPPAHEHVSLGARLARWWRSLTSEPTPLPEPQRLPPSALLLPSLVMPPEVLRTSEPEPAAPAPPPLPSPAQPAPADVALAGATQPAGARLAVNCFGPFRVSLEDQPIERWDSTRGRTIFKYLITRRPAPAPKELLADMFWADSEPELARRSLHQAVYCLRQSFKRIDPAAAIVLFNGDCYQLNPAISIWVDSEEFYSAVTHARASRASGRIDEAMRSYALAADLAKGEFLEEERYEAWAEELRRSYSTMVTEALRELSSYHYERGDYATAILFCQRLLARESCDEEAHLLLMRCYTAQGLRHMAVRQYQICANTLRTELGLSPSDELEAFYQQVVALA
jgi:DNA-binding SARP family transcriptional activator